MKEDGRSYDVVFIGGISINEGVKLVDNARHPSIAEDYARTFRALQGLKPDIVLAQHPAIYRMAEKVQRLKAGAARNPFVDPEGYQRVVRGAKDSDLKQLEQEKRE